MMENMQEIKYTIFTDGSSRGNPGKGGWGAIILSTQNEGELKVETKKGNNTRISLAFNTFYKGTIGLNTKLTELIL